MLFGRHEAQPARRPRAPRAEMPSGLRGEALQPTPASAENFQAPRRDNDLPKIKNKVGESTSQFRLSAQRSSYENVTTLGQRRAATKGPARSPGLRPPAVGRFSVRADGIKLGNEGSFHQTVPEDCPRTRRETKSDPDLTPRAKTNSKGIKGLDAGGTVSHSRGRRGDAAAPPGSWQWFLAPDRKAQAATARRGYAGWPRNRKRKRVRGKRRRPRKRQTIARAVHVR